MTPPLLVVGEVRTALLMNSAPLTAAAAAALLGGLTPGTRVRAAERPLARTVSADLVEAVDCPVRTGPAGTVRGVGTLLAQARIVGGRLLQASARGSLASGDTRRLPWAHYLERIGTVELIGRVDPGALARGFPGDRAPDRELDPGAVCERLLTRVQGSSALDHHPAFRARRTRLRWSAAPAPRGRRPHGTFTLHSLTERTLELGLPADHFPDPRAIAALCEDLALHDWLLSVLADVTERACAGPADARSLQRIRPAVHHLLHLWAPGTDVPPELLPIWDDLETRPGLTRQWQTIVQRIRDFMSLHTLEALTHQPSQPSPTALPPVPGAVPDPR